MLPLILAGAGALGSGIVNGIASNKAAKQLQEGERLARGDIENYTGKAAGYQQPYYDMGTQNTRTLNDMVNRGSFDVNPYSYSQQEQQPQAFQPTEFNFQQDPGYQFQLNQGLNSVQGGAAARGNGLSGATMKALQKYGTGLANQSYGDAFGRYIQGNQMNMAANQNALGQYNTNRNAGMSNEMNRYNTANQQSQQKYGQFNDLSQMGRSAAGNLTGLYQGAGNSIANTRIGEANAGAAGTMAIGNAISSGLRTIGNLGMTYGAMQNSGGSKPVSYNLNFGSGNAPLSSQELFGGDVGSNYYKNNEWQAPARSVPLNSLPSEDSGDNYYKNNGWR
jgi:hypothetical protein